MASPKSYITVTDDSIYTQSSSPMLPLIFIATEENKFIPNTEEIAPGTTKEMAGEWMLVNGQRDVVQTFGNSVFQEDDGTIQQGDELNEVGLWSLWSTLGIASSAYVVRADIDLKQLEMTQEEPSQDPTNGSKWFDLSNTEFGVFRANGNSVPALAWDNINVSIVPSSSIDEITGFPMDDYGVNGAIAITSLESNSNELYEKIDSVWDKIGSAEWFSSKPTEVVGTLNATYTSGETIEINGSIVTLGGTGVGTVSDAVTSITSASIANIVATNDAGSLKISDNSGSDLILTEGTGTALADLGFTAGTFEGVDFSYAPHTSVPSGDIAGSLWVKTTNPNNGADYKVKEFLTSTNQWTELYAPMYESAINAEIQLGGSLNPGSLFVYYSTVGGNAQSIMEYGVSGPMQVTGDTITPAITAGDSFNITVANGTTSSIYGVTATTSDVADLVNVISNMNIPNMEVKISTTGAMQFIRTDGTAMQLSATIESVLNLLGFDATEYSKWNVLEETTSLSAPTVAPEDGTYWLNDDMQVDVMIADGDEWKAMHNINPALDPMGVQITSAEPTTQSNGAPLVDYDLWLDSADQENYPALYRWLSGEWTAIDKSDQTTPFGIVFNDARENAGPDYIGSTHTAFSTDIEDMLISDYADPDCEDPRTYASGTILFNTRYSTMNVKEYQSTFFTNALQTYPTGKFQVGNSPEFDVPGTTNNPSIERWINASGNDLVGAMYAGRKAQRHMVVQALQSAIIDNEDIRSEFISYNVVATPGYFECYDEMIGLVTDIKETAFIVTDTPPRLAPNGTDIQRWAQNIDNAATNGEEGRVSRYTYSSHCYPWGLGTNWDGSDVMIPSSAMKLRAFAYNDSVAYPWFPAAGIRRGLVQNASSVGYLTEENEYQPVILSEGLSDVLYDNNINPIKNIPNSGLTIWGDKSLAPYSSALDRENVDRLVIFIRTQIAILAKPYFFEINNERTRNNFKGAIEGMLADLIAKDGLLDFLVVCDESNNTGTRIDRNELWADVAIEPAKSINWIYVPIRIENTGAISGS